jgi:hypothetical protein
MIQHTQQNNQVNGHGDGLFSGNSHAAIAGIVWGIINLLIGYKAVQVNILNSAFWVSRLQCSRRELWHWLDRRYTCC